VAPAGGSRRRFVAASVAAFASIAIVRGPARAAQFEFKCASNNPVDNPSSIRLTQMWATIEQESGGRIHTQFFPNNQLGGDLAMLTQLRLGALQFFLVSAAVFASVVPPANIGFLGFAYRNPEEGARVMDGALGGYIRQEALAKGIYTFRSIFSNGMSEIGSNSHPIRNPDDLHNFKIRIPESKILVDLFKTLGATPTPLSMGETYTSLQTHLIDGESLSMDTLEAARLYEVNKYISLTDHGWSGPWLIANGAMWKSLPPDLQEIVERNTSKYALLQRADTKVSSMTVEGKLRTQGVAFNRPNPARFRSRLGPYFQEWAAEFGPTAWGMLESGIGHKLS
jgi:TRAP-type transport system periplasmic protein